MTFKNKPLKKKIKLHPTPDGKVSKKQGLSSRSAGRKCAARLDLLSLCAAAVTLGISLTCQYSKCWIVSRNAIGQILIVLFHCCH